LWARDRTGRSRGASPALTMRIPFRLSSRFGRRGGACRLGGPGQRGATGRRSLPRRSVSIVPATKTFPLGATPMALGSATPEPPAFLFGVRAADEALEADFGLPILAIAAVEPSLRPIARDEKGVPVAARDQDAAVPVDRNPAARRSWGNEVTGPAEGANEVRPGAAPRTPRRRRGQAQRQGAAQGHDGADQNAAQRSAPSSEAGRFASGAAPPACRRP
jgi:hypothetical protein